MTRFVSALIFIAFPLAALADDIDLEAVSSLKVDLQQVVELGTVSAVDGVTSAGQPDEAALEVFADAGYAAIIDLRGPEEDRGFDQKTVIEELGMYYVLLPIVGPDAVNFENAGKLDDLLAQFDAPVLVHCKSGNRVGGLMALRASLNGADAEEAIEHGKDAGLTRLEDVVRERLAERAE